MAIREVIDSLVMRAVTKDFFPHANLISKDEHLTIMEVQTTAEDLTAYIELMVLICPSDLFMACLGPSEEEITNITFRYGSVEDLEEMDEAFFDNAVEVFRLNIIEHEEPSEDDTVDLSKPDPDDDWEWI